MLGLSREVMFYLQINWEMGILISSAALVVLYLIMSFICLFRCRHVDMHVWVLTFFPVVNIVLLFMSFGVRAWRRHKKKRLETKNIQL